MDNKKTGKLILKLRTKMGLSQSKLAEMIPISRQAVSKWERGETIPDSSTLVRLSEIFGVSVDDLLLGSSDSVNKNKKFKKWYIVLIILVLCITPLFLVCYYIHNYNIARSLYDMIEVYTPSDIYPSFAKYMNFSNNFYSNGNEYEKLSDEAKLYYAYKTIKDPKRINISSCEDLKSYYFNDEELSTICLKDPEVLVEGSPVEWRFYDVDKEKLEKAYHRLFGDDKVMPLKSFAIEVTGVCLYSEEKDNFLCHGEVGGDTSPEHFETMYDHFEMAGNAIEIYDRFIMITYDIDGKKYYDSPHVDEDKLIDSNTKDFSKGGLYKHTFRKDKNGKYYWYSSEKVD